MTAEHAVLQASLPELCARAGRKGSVCVREGGGGGESKGRGGGGDPIPVDIRRWIPTRGTQRQRSGQRYTEVRLA